MIVKADAFGAFLWNDVVNVLRDRRTLLPVEFPRHAARVDRGVRAFRFAGSTIDTVARDNCRHRASRAPDKFGGRSAFQIDPINAYFARQRRCLERVFECARF